MTKIELEDVTRRSPCALAIRAATVSRNLRFRILPTGLTGSSAKSR